MSLFFPDYRPSLRPIFQASWAPVAPGGHVKLLPPLLSSVPLLPEDSVGEEDGIMGIFDRCSSIISLLKMSPGVMMNWGKKLCLKLLVLFSGVWTVQDQTHKKFKFLLGLLQQKPLWGTEICRCQAFSVPRWADGGLSPLQSLYCVAASGVEMQMGWGPAMSSSSHLLHVNRLRVSSLWASGSVTVCGRSSVAAPQKGARGWGGWRVEGVGWISPTRCVSSMLICHPLNLYCSSTGSISHIARTLVPLRLGSSSCRQTEKQKEKQQQRWLWKLSSGRAVTLDRFPSSSVSSCLLCPWGHPSVNTPLRYLHLKGMITWGEHYYIYQPLQFVFPLLFLLFFASEFQLHFPLLYIWSVWLPPIHNDPQCLLRSCLLTPISLFFDKLGIIRLLLAARRKRSQEGIIEFWMAAV